MDGEDTTKKCTHVDGCTCECNDKACPCCDKVCEGSDDDMEEVEDAEEEAA